LCIKIANVES